MIARKMQRLTELAEATVVVVVTVATAAAARLLAYEASSNQLDELRVLLLPCIGALIVTGGMILANTDPEKIRVTLARSVFSLFFGTVAPFILTLCVWDSVAVFLTRPVVLFASGGLSAMICYVLIIAIAYGLRRRSDQIADKIIDRVEDKYLGHHEPPDGR